MALPRKWLPTDKTCPACGSVWRATSNYQIRIQEFCSRLCRTKVHGNGRPKVKKTKRNCKKCGVEMEILPCHLKTKWFCGYQCSNSYNNKGPRSGSWKGGNARYWKRKCRERDDFTCQLPGCGKRNEGKGIHAHHKIPCKVGGTDTLDNLITLCNQHHREMERQLLAGLVEQHPAAVREVASQLYTW